MHVTGGRVSVHHQAQRHAPSRLGLPLFKGYTATTTRILRQLAADHRSVAMILAVPVLVITLMYFMFENAPHRPGTPSPFNNACLIMLGVFPLIVMFLITSITMQRERVSGTLERILTTPLRRLDLLAAYGTAFSNMKYISVMTRTGTARIIATLRWSAASWRKIRVVVAV